MNATRRFLLAGGAASALGACAPRAQIVLVPPGPEAVVRRIFVGTSRAPDPADVFGTGRAGGLSYARVDVSIPAQRGAGEIPLPARYAAPDTRKHFAAVGSEGFTDAAAFRAAFARALGPAREAVVYVHGFNNTYAEGIYRIAQIGHDLRVPGVSVHYSWPSAAQPLNYAYDRDSALFARDGLERLLREIRAAGAAHVTLVAHSMGALLTMETLRQIEIGGAGGVRRLVQAVVLFSPDIDVELFRTQAARIGPLPDPFVIFTSRRDRALALSARLTGQRNRLGNLTDYAALADLRVIILDISAFESDGLSHFQAAQSASLLQLLNNVRAVDRALGADPAGRVGLFPGTILTLQNATAIILAPVAEISG